MTLDKFRDIYQEAAKELPRLQMDAEQVRDELHHYRMQKRGRRYLLLKGCTAAAVFLLCGAGTVVAKNIRNSIIEVGGNGFTITSVGTDLPPEEGLPNPASILKEGGVFSIEEDIPEEEMLESYEVEAVEYNSLEEFMTEGDVAVAVPDRALLGDDFAEESVVVMDEGRNIHIRLFNDDMYFMLSQFDNREFECYSSATSFMGASANERSFTNNQGISYVMFDTLDDEGEPDSVHAVVSINGRDLTLTFHGFEESYIEEILFSLDLSIYFQE